MVERSLPRAVEHARGVREGEAESLVAEDWKEEAGAAKERSSERQRQWRAVARPLRLSRRARVREGEWTSVNGRGGRSECDRGLLVADFRACPPRRMRATRR